MKYKSLLSLVVGSCLGFIYCLCGGPDMHIACLLFVIGLDILFGVILAVVFKKSNKTKSGRLSSNAMFLGICKKFCMILVVAMCYRIDLMLNINYVRNACIIAFVFDEAISILEHCAQMGVRIPQKVKDALEVLNKKN